MTGIKRIKLTEFHLRLTQKQRLYRREVICGNQIVNDVVPEPDKRQKPVIARTFGHILRFTYRQTYILIRSPLINIISADTLFIQMYIIPRQTQNLRGVSPCVVTEQKKRSKKVIFQNVPDDNLCPADPFSPGYRKYAS